MLDDACQLIVNAQMPQGNIVSDGNIATTLGGLLLLANPDPRFLDGARRAARDGSSANLRCSFPSTQT